MTKRFTILLTLAAALLGADALVGDASKAEAQEVQITGPLAGQPAVRHMRVYRRNRLQLVPFTGFTLQEPYRRTMFFGAQLNYHFTDWLGIGVVGAYGGVGFDTNLTEAIQDQGVTTGRNRLSLPTRRDFPDQVASLPWFAAVQMTLVPLRGKLALFQHLFLDTDFYLFGGVAFVGIEERANIAAATCENAPDAAATGACYAASQTARNTRTTIAPTFGAGLNMYFTEWMGLSIEWRGLPFAWNQSGTDEAGDAGNFPDGVIDSQDRFFKLNHMFTFGLVFYLPGRAGQTE